MLAENDGQKHELIDSSAIHFFANNEYIIRASLQLMSPSL